jgi:hypothetical protein
VALGYSKLYGAINPFDWMEMISLQGKVGAVGFDFRFEGVRVLTLVSWRKGEGGVSRRKGEGGLIGGAESRGAQRTRLQGAQLARS